MKLLYFHIGTEKTGSKTLQKFLYDNEAVLNQSGFSYFCNPQKLYFADLSHFPVVACLNPDLHEFVPIEKRHQHSEALSQLRQDMSCSDQEIAIISNEHFSSRIDSAAQLSVLKQTFKEYHVKIVCYIRRQDELALSSYSTGVMCGRREPFSLDEVNPQNRYFNYSVMLGLWEEAFGRENIIVRPFGKESLVGADIRRDFLSVIGIKAPEEFVFGEYLNVSLDATQVEAMRLINQHLPALEDGDRSAYDRAQSARGILSGLLPPGEPLSSLLENGEREILQNRFRLSNAQVESRFMATRALASWGYLWSSRYLSAQKVTPLGVSQLAPVAARLATRLASKEQELFDIQHSRIWRWARPLGALRSFLPGFF